MVTNIAVFLLFFAITSAGAQTFQYSRGWTNGKRGDARHDVTGALERDDVTRPVERLGPCQLRRLKYLLEGRPLNEKFYAPCDYHSDDFYSDVNIYRNHNPEPLIEVFPDLDSRSEPGHAFV